jgi:hypothetical protein
MPSVDQNLRIWTTDYDWELSGDEWSVSWGNAESQWWGSLYPRLHAFVPCDAILEIAPGFGRWTQYLKNLCQHLTVVDLTERCIKHCQERFADCSHITYAVNDGKSLSAVADQSIDLAFSFDSLVHAEADVLEAYVNQLVGKLRPEGVGFIHHSNALGYRRYFSLARRLPRGRGLLARKGLLRDDHGRSLSMSAELFRKYCREAGLNCISQEIINWGGRDLIDCISVVARKASRWDRPCQVLENREFMEEARHLRRVAPLYTGFPVQTKWPNGAGPVAGGAGGL